MLQSLGERSLGLVLVLVFIAALLLMEAMYLLWKANRSTEAKKLSRRMEALAAHKKSASGVHIFKDKGLSHLPVLERLLSNQDFAIHLQRRIAQSGSTGTVVQLVLSTIIVGFLGFVMSAAALGLPTHFALMGALLMACMPWFYIAFKRQRRLDKMSLQLPDALDFITRSLRSGQAFTAALLLAGEELPEPIASEFRTAHDEVTFGVSLGDALTNLSERVPLTDVRYFVVAVLTQRESGGNLTEVLEKLSQLIRARYKLMWKIRILSAEGRFSALILISFPFALGGLMNLINPEFMSKLWTDPIGISIIKALAILMLFGVLMLRKIIKIHV